jgi:hypothetical protein
MVAVGSRAEVSRGPYALLFRHSPKPKQRDLVKCIYTLPITKPEVGNTPKEKAWLIVDCLGGTQLGFLVT